MCLFLYTFPHFLQVISQMYGNSQPEAGISVVPKRSKCPKQVDSFRGGEGNSSSVKPSEKGYSHEPSKVEAAELFL